MNTIPADDRAIQLVSACTDNARTDVYDKVIEAFKEAHGRKGKFRLLSKELIDAQGITLEESPEELEGGEQPKRLKVFLKDPYNFQD